MTWTTDPPTAPGYYWHYSGDPRNSPELVHVDFNDPKGVLVWIMGWDIPVKIGKSGSRWFGPLTPPDGMVSS